MATLLLTTQATAGTTSLNSPSLRSWMNDDWALLFSHPDDFVRYDLEMDRWLVITERAFAARRIRPIALASATTDPAHSWVGQVSGDTRTVLLEDSARQHFGPVDLQTPVLREEIESTARRFVMIIDSRLRIRKLFTYQTLSNLPSPLELLGWADALRSKQEEAEAEENNRVLAQPERESYSFAVRRHRHRTPLTACAPALHVGSTGRAGYAAVGL